MCVIEGLTQEQKRKYRILDNKTAENAKWDFALLEEELEGLDFEGFDFGFNLPVDEEEREIIEDEAPAINEEAPPITQAGDIWVMGRHRLMCGDSTDVKMVQKLMGGQMADLMITDPPYNVDYTGKNKDALKIKNGKMEDSNFRLFCRMHFGARMR